MIPPVRLSENGPEVSRIVLGMKNAPADFRRLIELGVQLGLTTFDHADIYGDYSTEAAFGKALKMIPDLREKIQIITKVGIRAISSNRPHHPTRSYDTSIEHIYWSVDRSLKNFQTDYIDLLLIHRPDPLMHPDDLAYAFDGLQRSGKVRHFGVANFTPSQFEMLSSRVALVTNQVRASIMHLTPFLDGTMDQCLKYRICPMAWSPLGGAAFSMEPPSPQMNRIKAIGEEIMQKRENIDLGQLLLAWLMHHPAGIIPVLDVDHSDRLTTLEKALRIQLTREEWFELWQASRGKEVL